MIEDSYQRERLTDATAPADKWFAITPSDSADLARKPRAVWSGAGGDIAMVGADGASVTFTEVPAGTLVPFSPHRVLATGTTATGLIGVY